MARSTWLVILIKNIYTLWGRKRFFLPVTYLPTNLADHSERRLDPVFRAGEQAADT